MRTVDIKDLLNVLTSNGISVSKFEIMLNEEAMPAETAVADEILNTLNNYAHYAINNNFKKHDNNVKKFLELYEDAKRCKNDKKLAAVKENFVALCQKLPKDYVALSGADYVGDHVATISNYVDQYVIALNSLKETNANNSANLSFLNDAIELLEQIKNEAVLLWDISSQNAINILENAITTIQKFGKDTALGFLVKTRLVGLETVKENIVNANRQYLSTYYPITPGKTINSSLIVKGQILNDSLVVTNAVKEKRYEYEAFKALIKEKNKPNEENQARLESFIKQKEEYNRQIAELYQKWDNGIYLGTGDDFDSELDLLEASLNETNEYIQMIKDLTQTTVNPMVVELNKICIKIDMIALHKSEFLNIVLKGIDFATLMPLIDGAAVGLDMENAVKYFKTMTISLDKIVKGNKAAVEELKNTMNLLNEHIKPKTGTTIKTGQKTPEQIAAEEAAKAEERRKRRERLTGQSVSGGGQTPLQQTPVQNPRPLVTATEDPIDND